MLQLEGPGHDTPGVRLSERRGSGDKVGPIPILPEEGPPLDPRTMTWCLPASGGEDAGRIQAGTTGRGRQRTGARPGT